MGSWNPCETHGSEKNPNQSKIGVRRGSFAARERVLYPFWFAHTRPCTPSWTRFQDRCPDSGDERAADQTRKRRAPGNARFRIARTDAKKDRLTRMRGSLASAGMLPFQRVARPRARARVSRASPKRRNPIYGIFLQFQHPQRQLGLE